MENKAQTPALAATPQQKPKLQAETLAALAGSAVAGAWLFLTTINAGPLWRDEVNSINIAQMPLRELWNNLCFESFPPLWLMLLRVWSMVGMAGSDAGIRVLGLFIGLSFLGSLWLCIRLMGGRAPTLTLALLGSLPAFVFTVSSNRAYGLAMCLLLLTFGTIWRLVQSPSKSWMLLAGLTSFLFLHSLYYNAVFLCAMFLGAASVVIRRRDFKTLAGLVAIGALCALSMGVYLPVLRRGASYAPMTQVPFGARDLWEKVADTLTARSNAQPSGINGPEVWIWIVLIVVAAAVGIRMQLTSSGDKIQATDEVSTENRRDLGLFCLVSMLGGTTAYLGFLLNLRFPTQPWYYIGVLTLSAISLEGLLGIRGSSFRPWGLLRTGFLVLAFAWYGSSVWEETHVRRSNVDLIAAVLKEKAKEQDLIIVHFAWEGITFDRYYQGKARWITIPPIDSHKVHRGDLLWEKLNDRDPIAPVLTQADLTLRSGNSVWLIGRTVLLREDQLPSPPPPPPHPKTGFYLGPYGGYWGAKIAAHLLDRSAQAQSLTTKLDVPVNLYEDLPLLRFSGYRSESNASPLRVSQRSAK